MIFLYVLHELKNRKVMNKALIIAKREYRAAVKTKGFIIGILLLPVFMGGGLLVFTLFKDKVDTEDKNIAVVDYSGLFKDHLVKSAEDWNNSVTVNAKGQKNLPYYSIEYLEPDNEDPAAQKLKLSNMVREKNLHAFVRIGANVIHPVPGDEQSAIFYYAENAAMDNIRGWIGNILNNKIREVRLLELGMDNEKVKDLFYWVNTEAMGLVNMDTKTGEVSEARKSNELQTILVPYILLLLMFMMLMMSAVPLLTAVMEEKTERIAEVLLGSATPWEFMTGKIIGGLAVSLTTAAIYVAGAVFTLSKMDLSGLIPYDVIPWFFIYMILNIIMVGSIMAALGAICNDSKDAQAMQFPAMLPVIIPLFLMMPIIMNPMSKMAVGTSLFPLWTPMLMLLRQSTSVTIPVWQIIVGLIGVVLFTILCVWVGARIFRSAIIMQGKRPKFRTLMRYIFKG